MTKGLLVQLFTDFRSNLCISEPPTTTRKVLDMYISKGQIVNILMALWLYIRMSSLPKGCEVFSPFFVHIQHEVHSPPPDFHLANFLCALHGVKRDMCSE